MITAVLSGCAIGGIMYSFKELSRMFFNNKSIDNNNIISKEIWEDIWCRNDVFIEVDKDNILTPLLLSVEEITNGLKYIFKMPLGITSKDLQVCKMQVKELSNAIDVQISHQEGDIAYIDVATRSDIEVFEGTIDNERWNKLWIELELTSKISSSGYKYPALISESDIVGGVSYVFQMPVGKSSHHVLKHDITIKEFLEAKQIEILPISKNRVEIKAFYKELPEIVPFKFLPRSSEDSFEIPIGKFIDGYAVLDFKKVANVLDSGMQGSGKSIATKWALTYLGCMYTPDELQIYISDLKITELNRFENMKHVVKYVDTVKDTDIMIRELKEIMQNRYKIFKSHKVSDIYEYNKKFPESKMPYIFVAIEEISSYTVSTSLKSRYKYSNEEDQNEVLSELLFKSRASGISVWCTVQRPTKENLNQDVKSSLGNILGFKTVDGNNSIIVCGKDEKLEKLRGKGNGYFITEGIDKEFQGFYIENDEIDKILKDRDLLKEESEYDDI